VFRAVEPGVLSKYRLIIVTVLFSPFSNSLMKYAERSALLLFFRFCVFAIHRKLYVFTYPEYTPISLSTRLCSQLLY